MRFCQTTTMFALSLAALTAAVPQAPALGQTEAIRQNATSICMIGTSPYGNRFAIIVPATDTGHMRAKGFEPGQCEDAFASQAEREAFRDSICWIASSWREDLQQHFERERGERPAVLCGMAEIAVGQWEGAGRQ